MLTIRSYLAPSKIEGLGLYCRDTIKKGEVVWVLDTRYDRLISVADWEAAPGPMKDFLDRYAYPYSEDRNYILLDSDEGRFMNHDPQPNCDFSQHGKGVALRDIPAGEELTCDYGSFFGDTPDMLGHRHEIGAEG